VSPNSIRSHGLVCTSYSSPQPSIPGFEIATTKLPLTACKPVYAMIWNHEGAFFPLCTYTKYSRTMTGKHQAKMRQLLPFSDPALSRVLVISPSSLPLRYWSSTFDSKYDSQYPTLVRLFSLRYDNKKHDGPKPARLLSCRRQPNG
jgi:hypothetical protein